MKYGVAAYMGWFYLNKTLSGGGDHGHESHGEEHGKGHWNETFRWTLNTTLNQKQKVYIYRRNANKKYHVFFYKSKII